MGRLRKPDPNIMTKEDYATFSKAYEAQESKSSIRAALDKNNAEAAAREAAYKPAPSPTPSPANNYNNTATKITPEMGLPMPGEKTAVTTETAKATLEPDPFFSAEGQKARLKNAISTPVQAVLSQFGLAPDIEADNSLVKWLANNPLVTAAPLAIAYAAVSATVGTLATKAAAAKFAALPYEQFAPALGIEMTTTAGQGWALTTTAASTIPAIAINTKTMAITATALTKIISPKTLLLLGTGAISIVGGALAYIGLIGTGYWAEAEQPEGVSIVVNTHIIDEAIRTGDWTLFHETIDAGDEIMKVSSFEKNVAGTPLMYPVEAKKKGEMTMLGYKALKQLGTDIEQSQLDGTDEATQWAEIDEREEEQKTLMHERALAEIDYFNAAALKNAQLIADIKTMADVSDNQRYLKTLERAMKIEEDSAERIRQAEMDYTIWMAEFWAEYRRIKAELSTPSALGFGLL